MGRRDMHATTMESPYYYDRPGIMFYEKVGAVTLTRFYTKKNSLIPSDDFPLNTISFLLSFLPPFLPSLPLPPDTSLKTRPIESGSCVDLRWGGKRVCLLSYVPLVSYVVLS